MFALFDSAGFDVPKSSEVLVENAPFDFELNGSALVAVPKTPSLAAGELKLKLSLLSVEATGSVPVPEGTVDPLSFVKSKGSFAPNLKELFGVSLSVADTAVPKLSTRIKEFCSKSNTEPLVLEKALSPGDIAKSVDDDAKLVEF